MAKRLLLISLFTILVIGWASCTKENDNPGPDTTRLYFPLQIGRYVIYDVDSVVWDDFDCSEGKKHLNIRYTVSDTFRDNANELSYRIDVHERPHPDTAWKVSQVFSVTPSGTGIHVTAQNLRFQKMIFPVAEGKIWFGNKAIDTTEQALRHYGGWVYRYSDLAQPYDNGSSTFENTVTVTAIDDSLNSPGGSAYAERSFFREVYGYDIGLIYREAIFWTYDPGSTVNACKKGTSVVMRASSWH